MNKKILIGSIIAVIILIGVSFTSVVGYRSGASDVKASPLFNIRSSRAIDEESDDLNCEYVGKGEEYSLSIPERDNETILIQQAINGIRKMNEEEFNRFVIFTINKLLCENKINEKDISQLKHLLIHLQNLPEGFVKIQNFRNEDNKKLYSKDSKCLTFGAILNCILLFIVTIFLIPIAWIYARILDILYILTLYQC